MNDLIVSVFYGSKEQVPKRFQVKALTYRDVITQLILYGLEPGSLYGIHGENLNTDDPIACSEAQYIISEECTRGVRLIRNNQVKHTTYGPQTLIQDIYNAIIAFDLKSDLYTMEDQAISLPDHLTETLVSMTTTDADGLIVIQIMSYSDQYTVPNDNGRSIPIYGVPSQAEYGRVPIFHIVKKKYLLFENS